MSNKILAERIHGKKIASLASHVWGWESTAGKLRWKRRIKMLISHIESKDCVLEVGCGTGHLTRELARIADKVISIDVAEDLIKIAKNNCNFDNTSFLLQDASQLGLSGKSFDAIVGSSILHHLDIELALGEFYRVLKPKGSICFAEPNMVNPQIFIQKNIPFVKKISGDLPHETAFFRWQLKKKLKKCGFKNIQIKNFDFLHPAIPEKLIKTIKKVESILELVPILSEFSGSLCIKAQK